MREHGWTPAPPGALRETRTPEGDDIVAMAPIPNPEPGYGRARGAYEPRRVYESRRIYERRRAYQPRPVYEPRRHWAPRRRHHHHALAAPTRRPGHWTRPHHRHAAPIRHERPYRPVRPAIAHHARHATAARPAQTVHARPAPHPIRPAPKPAAKLVRHAPAAKRPAPPVKPAASADAYLQNRLDRLGAAVAYEMRNARLEAPAAARRAGRRSRVALTLPATLPGSLKAEAARLGLRQEASRLSISVVLAGTGYEIAPKAPQVRKLEVGKPVVFEWQAQRVDGRAGPLIAEVRGVLRGGARPESFSLGRLSVRPAAAGARVTSAPAAGPEVKIPEEKVSHRTFAGIPAQWVVIGAVSLLGLLLVLAVVRGLMDQASGRRGRRRRLEIR